MAEEQPTETDSPCDILAVDSDPSFLRQAGERIAADGHRAWGARDLIAAMSFLADRRPDAIVVELDLLDSDGADPLGDLRAAAPDVPIILTAPGAPDADLVQRLQAHRIFAYHDKSHGSEALTLWVNAAVSRAGGKPGETAEGGGRMRWV